MPTWLIVLFVVIGVVVFGVAAGLVMRRVQRPLRVESGWEAWAHVAATLPWRDRFALMWSTSTGRPVKDVRLAALAAQRSDAAWRGAIVWTPRTRWLRWILAVIWLANAGLQAADGNWLFAALLVPVAALWVCMPLIVRSDIRRAVRSAEANSRLACEE